VGGTLNDLKIRHVKAHANNIPEFPKVWEDRVIQNLDLEFSNGNKEFFDLVIVCTGVKPNNTFLIDGQTPEGFIQVDKCLRVQGKEHIWAIGDCCNISDHKFG